MTLTPTSNDECYELSLIEDLVCLGIVDELIWHGSNKEQCNTRCNGNCEGRLRQKIMLLIFPLMAKGPNHL